MWPSAVPSHKSRVVAPSHWSPDQDEASDVHLLSGALLAIQLLPPSLEMKIGLGHPSGPPPAATANLVASLKRPRLSNRTGSTRSASNSVLNWSRSKSRRSGSR